ncbi:hypothetical protein SNEBB_008167 [Seison nebaliae]|nr:hypothetical protein SNEBB_008167 [Seison nebaliae]
MKFVKQLIKEKLNKNDDELNHREVTINFTGTSSSVSPRTSDDDHVTLLGEPKKNQINKNYILCVIAALIGCSFPFGYHISVVNVPQQVLEDWFNLTYAHTHPILNGTNYIPKSLLKTYWSIAVGIVPFGGIFGGCGSGLLADYFGRRGLMMLNNLPLIIGPLVISFAYYFRSFSMFFAGRFIVGVGVGIASGVAPLYLNEITVLSERGRVGMAGLSFFLGRPQTWPYLMSFTIIPNIIQLLLFIKCPESPKYTISKLHNFSKAMKALQFIRGTSSTTVVEKEVGEIKEADLHDRNESDSNKFMHIFKSKVMRSALFVCILLQLGQQYAGINAVNFYSTSIFTSAGLTENVAQFATIATGGVQLFMTFVAMMLMDRLGRRSLFITSLFIMFTFITALFFFIKFQHLSKFLSYMSIFSVITYLIGYSIGAGPIPWLITAEMFPDSVRGAAMSICTFINWTTACSVGVLFPIIENVIGPYSFLIFTSCLAILILTSMKMLIETKNRSVDEIYNELKK